MVRKCSLERVEREGEGAQGVSAEWGEARFTTTRVVCASGVSRASASEGPIYGYKKVRTGWCFFFWLWDPADQLQGLGPFGTQCHGECPGSVTENGCVRGSVPQSVPSALQAQGPQSVQKVSPECQKCVLVRKAPDTFNFLRHVMRAIWSVRPKCSHRCVSLKKSPSNLCKSSLTRPKTQPSKRL